MEDEPKTVSELGMEYIYVPVDFSQPTENDFSIFCEELDKFADRKVHVHCIYNARVSAFFYRRAKLLGRGDEDKLLEHMTGIWKPGGAWAEFIGDRDSITEPNKFAGYDY